MAKASMDLTNEPAEASRRPGFGCGRTREREPASCRVIDTCSLMHKL
jgi:hypothetical protein